jgi:hypothetical protein
MTYYAIEPEVPGTLGDGATFDYSQVPYKLITLEYIFDCFPKDDLITAHPAFLVTTGLQEALEEINITGVEFQNIKTGASDFFTELHGQCSVPKYNWMKIIGQAGIDDAGIHPGPPSTLIISDRVLNCLQGFEISNAVITEFSMDK